MTTAHTTTDPATPFAEIQEGDIVTFGSRTSEWFVADNDGHTLTVRCVSHPKAAMVGGYQHLIDGQTMGVWLAEPREQAEATARITTPLPVGDLVAELTTLADQWRHHSDVARKCADPGNLFDLNAIRANVFEVCVIQLRELIGRLA